MQKSNLVHFFDLVTDSASFESASQLKGLQNRLGDNNCFLNVVIQALWKLEAFRNRFSVQQGENAGSTHLHREHCVYCALESIFTQYRFSAMSLLPPTALRETLSVLFKDSAKFQMFELDDAAEAFEAVLDHVHLHLTRQEPSSSPQFLNSNHGECREEACVSHQVFGLRMVEQVCCEQCSYRSDPFGSTLFTAYGYAAMLRQTRLELGEHATFDTIFHRASRDTRPCPNRNRGSCTNLEAPVQHWLLSLPEVFSVNVIWDSAQSSVDEIEQLLDCISLEIDLEKIFALERSFRFGARIDSSAKYRFRGMICYYGKHYNAHFYHTETQSWYLFDDATVKQVTHIFCVSRLHL